MQQQHSEHLAKQLATGIRSVVADLNDTVVVGALIELRDIDGNRIQVQIDGTYPQTRTQARWNGQVIGSWLNHKP